ncbi:uncharacterized protein OCT59_026726 [Rhizophagus irregularis]|uniref:uncharacterized protein n=1 Tax=Rhizophagus irregularis TaxID=588596 RepID=UPI00332559A6|nr:hypothetical protein OCT59_026726 [Rhizophagus irregularis]
MTSQPQIPSSQGLLLKLQIHPTLMASEEVFLSDSGIFLEFGSCRPSITDYSDECIVLPSTLKAATPVGATTILFSSVPMAIILKGAMDSTLSRYRSKLSL